MFNPNAEPVGHEPPYRRISINDRTPGGLVVEVKTTAEICEALMKQHEANRIWALVKGAAEGSNISSGEYEAPTEDAA